ncbi:MAG TPA: excalibur calcium-binding domain-containing protein [Arthrobacter sp.]|nr:excalibur calcium-binding domain-containing protein [Arthrobacter sp.]
MALQTAVKAKYDLWMTQAEHDAIAGILTSKCPKQPVPDDSGGVDVPIAATPAPEDQAPAPESPGAPAAPGQIYYENCTAAEEAGAAPVHRGDPGCGEHLDGDGDGSACE